MGQCQAAPCRPPAPPEFDRWSVFAWTGDTGKLSSITSTPLSYTTRSGPRRRSRIGSAPFAARSRTTPKHIPGLSRCEVQHMGIGSTFALIIDPSSSVYIWGKLPGIKARHSSRKGPVKLTIPIPIGTVACGAQHAVALQAGGGHVYAAGDGTHGQLGLSHSHTPNEFQCVVSLCNEDVIQVACGLYHTLALTRTGSVYAWGGAEDFSLGTGRPLDIHTPHAVQGFDNNIVHIACGDYFSVAVSRDGSVYCWGRNDHGQCGAPSSRAGHIPYPTVIPEVTVTAQSDLAVGPNTVLAHDSSRLRTVAWGGLVKSHQVLEIPDPLHIFPCRDICIAQDAAFVLKDSGVIYCLPASDVVGTPSPLSVFPYLSDYGVKQIISGTDVCVALCADHATPEALSAFVPELQARPGANGSAIPDRAALAPRHTSGSRSRRGHKGTGLKKGRSSHKGKNKLTSPQGGVGDRVGYDDDDDDDDDLSVCTSSGGVKPRSPVAGGLDDISLSASSGTDSDLNLEISHDPGSMLCPLSGELMTDPVFALDGHTYERAAIATWLQTNNTSPVTGEILNYMVLVPNFVARSQILEQSRLAVNTSVNDNVTSAWRGPVSRAHCSPALLPDEDLYSVNSHDSAPE